MREGDFGCAAARLDDLTAHIERGGRMLALCGGDQRPGRSIFEPNGVDSDPGKDAGLRLLDVDTILTSDNTLGSAAAGGRLAWGAGTARAFIVQDDGWPEGAVSSDGRITRL